MQIFTSYISYKLSIIFQPTFLKTKTSPNTTITIPITKIMDTIIKATNNPATTATAVLPVTAEGRMDTTGLIVPLAQTLLSIPPKMVRPQVRPLTESEIPMTTPRK